MTDQQTGWYPDPSGDVTKLRFWDGTQWTNDFTDSGVAAPFEAPTEPLAPAPAPAFEPAAAPAPVFEPAPAPAPAPMPAYEPAPVAPMPAYDAPPMPVQPTQPMQPAPAPAPAPAYGAPAPAPQQPGYPQPAQQPGAPGGPAPYYQQPAPPKKKSPLPLILIGVGALVVIGIVLAIVLTQCGGGSNNNNNNNNNNGNTGNTGTITSPIDNPGNTGNNNNNNNQGSGADIIDQILSGDVMGQVGVKYSTKWFDFTVNSLTTAQSYGSITAGNGNTLVIANLTITNTFGSTQPFGTFDWFVDDDTLAQYIFPLDPVSANMMPLNFDIKDAETVNYDVVIEIPANLPNPVFMYMEISSSGDVYTSFKIPIY